VSPFCCALVTLLASKSTSCHALTNTRNFRLEPREALKCNFVSAFWRCCKVCEIKEGVLGDNFSLISWRPLDSQLLCLWKLFSSFETVVLVVFWQANQFSAFVILIIKSLQSVGPKTFKNERMWTARGIILLAVVYAVRIGLVSKCSCLSNIRKIYSSVLGRK